MSGGPTEGYYDRLSCSSTRSWVGRRMLATTCCLEPVGPVDYVTDLSGHTAVARAKLDGTGTSFIPDAAGAQGIAVDGQHVYWADATAGAIKRANLVGTDVAHRYQLVLVVVPGVPRRIDGVGARTSGRLEHGAIPRSAYSSASGILLAEDARQVLADRRCSAAIASADKQKSALLARANENHDYAIQQENARHDAVLYASSDQYDQVMAQTDAQYEQAMAELHALQTQTPGLP